MTFEPTEPTSDPRPRRKATSLTVDSELLRQAKELDIPLSRTFEEALARKVTEERQKRWQQANAEAFDAIEQRIERDGLWSDGRRLF